jgi:hypothetical protein
VRQLQPPDLSRQLQTDRMTGAAAAWHCDGKLECIKIIIRQVLFSVQGSQVLCFWRLSIQAVSE